MSVRNKCACSSPEVTHDVGYHDCPTCSGPSRETVGLVCQTCGTDYGRANTGREESAKLVSDALDPILADYIGPAIPHEAIAIVLDMAEANLLRALWSEKQ